jgi:hypothetical protein
MGPLRAYHYFPECATYAVLFSEMFPIIYWIVIKKVPVILKDITIFS